MAKRIALLAALVMVLGLAAEARPASASLSDCTSGNWCMWSSTDWNPNPPGKWSWTAWNYDTSGWNNLNVGVYNNSSTGRGVKQYDLRNHGTLFLCTDAGYGHSNTSGQARYKDVSSHKFAPNANDHCNW